MPPRYVFWRSWRLIVPIFLLLLPSGCKLSLTRSLSMSAALVYVAPVQLVSNPTQQYAYISAPTATWIPPADASRVASYRVALGTSAGAADVAGWQDVGLLTSYQFSTLSLDPGQTYYISVRVADADGNLSASVSGPAWKTLAFARTISSQVSGVRSASANAQYGARIAYSEDGNTLAIGAPEDATDASGENALSAAGAVYVYVKSGPIWVFQQKLVPQGPNARQEGGRFGLALAISGDTIVVGDYLHKFDENGANPLTQSGAAWTFNRSGGVWTQDRKLVDEGTNGRVQNELFGSGVAIRGDTMAISSIWSNACGAATFGSNAGCVSIYTRSGGVWALQQKVYDTAPGGASSWENLGGALAFSSDSDTLVVGSLGENTDESGANSIMWGSGGVFIYVRSGGVWSLQRKITGPGPNGRVQYDNFGGGVSMSGETIVFGATGRDYDENGANPLNAAGAAYVYTRTGTTWNLQQILVGTGPNGRVAGDVFGHGIAIDGDTIAIGAAGQTTDASGANAVTGAGAVFVFTRTAGVWSLEQKVVPTGGGDRQVGDGFGFGIALRGGSLVVGASSHDCDYTGANCFTNAGVAYLFSKPGVSWVQDGKISNVMTETHRPIKAKFGHSTAVSPDGTTLLVGAPNDSYDENSQNYTLNAGAAYVYRRSGDAWILEQKLVGVGTNGRSPSDLFGTSVAIDGNTAVVGAIGQAYDEAGANSQPGAGAAYVYVRSGGVWSLQQKLVGFGVNSRASMDYFGSGVAISGDTIAVGAKWSDYDETGGASALNAGAVFVFTRSGSTWSPQQRIVASGVNGRVAGDSFGSAVALVGDTLAVGAPVQGYDATGANLMSGAGAVFVYERVAGSWSLQQRIVPTGTNARVASGNFGVSVALSETQDTLVAGSPGNGYDAAGADLKAGAGTAFVYKRTAGVWSQEGRLVASGTNGRNFFDGFGTSVAVSGDRAYAGAPSHGYDESGANSVASAGAVFVFERSGSTWSLFKKAVGVQANSRVESDQMGSSVAAAGDTFAIGVPGQSYDGSGGAFTGAAGACYVFYF